MIILLSAAEAKVRGRTIRQIAPMGAAVIVIGEDLDDATVWMTAVEAGAEHVVFLPDAEDWLLDRIRELRVTIGTPL